MRSLLLTAIVALACFGSAGCDNTPDLVWQPEQAQPIPATHLPVAMRHRNWSGRGQYGYGGSCVFASSKNSFEIVGRHDLVELFDDLRRQGYQGPETGNGILKKYRDQNIPHVYTDTGDVSLLQAASDARRPGIIFYYPNHCVTFVGFDTRDDGREFAVLLDNNFPDKYILIPRAVFESSWDYYDGFAAVPWVQPATPRTYPATRPRNRT